MYNIHTREKAHIIFKRDGVYDRVGLAKINWFLRDWRQGKQVQIDPRLLDAVWSIHRATGSSKAIHVLCGYRTSKTNSLLASNSSGVAKRSKHMLGEAIDFYIPGVSLEKLSLISIKQQHGGVGIYNDSGFVHVDIGKVRTWQQGHNKSSISKKQPSQPSTVSTALAAYDAALLKPRYKQANYGGGNNKSSQHTKQTFRAPSNSN